MNKLHFPKSYRFRRLSAVLGLLTVLAGIVIANPSSYESLLEQSAGAEPQVNLSNQDNPSIPQNETTPDNILLATSVLERLEIKGRAPKTGYNREEFYTSWPKVDGCNLRQRILKRELGATAVLAQDNCTVLSGEFYEPYTGAHMSFQEKSELSNDLQIDHVVALSDAWQKGAQYLPKTTRYEIATDPLNLLAVDAKANQGKSDGAAATWLPPNKAFRCQYIARQISVKYKYGLWVTEAEHDAMARILETCPAEPAVGVEL